MNTSETTLDKYREQQIALNELYQKGYSRMAVARLIGVTPNTVRAWENTVKQARGRSRARLLFFADKSKDDLKILSVNFPIVRGRISKDEHEVRVHAMKRVGLWPLDVCARKLRILVAVAKTVNVTTTEIIEWLGVGRRTFYEYLDEDNTRLMPLEVIERIQRFTAPLGVNTEREEYQSKPETLEMRFSRASIILFEEYCILGFTTRDIVKKNALQKLVEVTGYNERTLRRYIPLRTNNRRPPRAIVEAFEEGARLLGSIVRGES